MTPDELRRLDNDLCIIFEKGIKPVKANKYYYFKHKNMYNNLKKVAISHNDIEELDRGVWRKFNPYNPWTEDKTEKAVQNLKVESLDDLFEDVPAETEKKQEEPIKEPAKEEIKEEVSEPIGTISNDTIPMQEEEDTYDLQKELEAKFDELFGSLDE